MTALDTKEIKRRLEILQADLAQFPPGVLSPWPASRVFNELLKRAKQELPDDEVLGSIGYIRDKPADAELGSGVHVGTIRVLIGQILAAIEFGKSTTAAANRASRKPKRPSQAT